MRRLPFVHHHLSFTLVEKSGSDKEEPAGKFCYQSVLKLLTLIILNRFTWFKKNQNACMIYSVLISGMLFHILCEYTGVNTWYSRDYCEKLK